MKRATPLLFFSLSAAFLFLAAWPAKAATLYLIPDTRSLSIGQEFNVEVKIDTGVATTSINSAEATVQFPTGVLSAVSVEKQDSIFGFWLEEPAIANDAGTIHFVGGTTKGVSGSALQVLRIRFRATGAGTAQLRIADAAVTAADGKGTNVLSEVKETSVAVGTSVAAPPPLPVEEQPAEQPKKVERVAVAAAGVPGKPALRVPLYPDESRWYDHPGEVIVFWDLPPDVVQTESAIGHSPDIKPGEKDAELFTGKSFGVLKEGIWYVRARLKNNVGWGDFAYYKISLDTTAPLPFQITIDNSASDNPSPEIRYETSDSFSGIAGYSVFLDGTGPTDTTSTVMRLPAQPPGKHTVLVRAKDLAGNSIEDSMEFEVLPLPTPTVDFLTPSVVQGEFVFVSGKALPGGMVDVQAVNDKRQEIFKGTAAVDGAGHWDLTIKEPFATGHYLLNAVVRDDRGAVSVRTSDLPFTVKAKKIISFGVIELGWAEILLAIVLLGLSALCAAGWYSSKRKQMRGAYEVIASRDLEKLTALLLEDIKEFEELPRPTMDEKSSTEVNFLLGKIKETVGKTRKYLSEEIGKIK